MSDPASETMNGSLLIVEAENAEAVRAVMERDIYWASNVVSPSVPSSSSPTPPPLLASLSSLMALPSWCGGV